MPRSFPGTHTLSWGGGGGCGEASGQVEAMVKYKGIEVQLEEYMIGVISCLPSPAGIVGGGSTDVGSFLFAACLGHDTDASFCSAGPSFLYIALSVLVVSLSSPSSSNPPLSMFPPPLLRQLLHCLAHFRYYSPLQCPLCPPLW